MRNFQRIESEDGKRLAFWYRPSLGTVLFGAPFLAVGMFFLGEMVMEWSKSVSRFPYYVQTYGMADAVRSALENAGLSFLAFFLGSIFLVFGASAALLTAGTNFDAAKGTVVRWWRVFWIKWEKHYRVQDFSRVEVVYHARNVYSRPNFNVSVRGPNRRSILIETCYEVGEANKVARDLAARLQLNLILLEASI